jgi:hypothetical protein
MHHVIVQSEMAVRAANERMKAEIEKLRADCNRLRAIVGEPALTEPLVHVSALGDVKAFTAGNCQVTIGKLPGGTARTPMINPAAASARGRVAPRAQAQEQAPVVPIARPMEPAELDEQEMRFAMIELSELGEAGGRR